MQVDAATLRNGANWSGSVCIIGAGPAGLAVAESLRECGCSVVVLEGGKSTRFPEVETDDTGIPTGARATGVGGTANVWNTWNGNRTWAKYVPLDAIDFSVREWMPHSGWPITFDAMQPWYAQAHSLAGISGVRIGARPLTAKGTLHAGAYNLGPASQFTTTLPARLISSTNVLLVEGAHATRLTRTREGRVASVQWRGASGAVGEVRAEHYVLALGGIENARFLLADSADILATSTCPWLGCGFMEHPMDTSILVPSRDPSLGLGEYFPGKSGNDGDEPLVGRLGASPEFLAGEKLPNFSLRLGAGNPDAPENPVRVRSAIHRIVPSQRARRFIGNTLRSLARSMRASEYRLTLDLEQQPSIHNQVVLGNRLDQHGQPIAALRWTWSAAEELTRIRTRALVLDELRRMGLRGARISEVPLHHYAHHHAGSTRMHDDPVLGVVDCNLRVHGDENLYVVGSSVFPTSGVANPTLTVLALCARLASHLSGL